MCDWVHITDIPVLSQQVKVAESVREFRVVMIIDSQWSLTKRIAALCRSRFFQVRQLRPAEAAKVFISYRLDYCKSLQRSTSVSRIRKLRQSVCRISHHCS